MGRLPLPLVAGVPLLLLIYAVAEALWLTTAHGHYRRLLGEAVSRDQQLRLRSRLAAVLAYVVLLGSLWLLVLDPSRGDPVAGAWRGATFGVAVYGVYNLTNMGTLAGYSWKLVVMDTTWGCAVMCVMGVLAGTLL